MSVVVCAYSEKRWEELVAAVESLRRQSLPPRQIVVVIDHNPALLERVRAHLDDVVAVDNRQARGLAGARNSGVAHAEGEIVAFMDEDAVAAPDWLAEVGRCYAPGVVGVGGAIEPHWLEGRPGWFPPEFDWVVGCTYRGMPQATAPVRNLIGCNMSFRREAFAEGNGFRIGRVGVLSIGRENDETEFCIRLTEGTSSRLVYHPAARVHHRVPGSRCTRTYFVRRCYSEGLSKARLTALVGSDSSLSNERTYVTRALPLGVLRGLADAARGRDTYGLGRAAAIVAGFAATLIGYCAGRAVELLGDR